MAFQLEHDFAGAKYTVVGDEGQLEVMGPDLPKALVHFVKIFNECSIDVTGLNARQPANGQLVLSFKFETEEEEDLQLLVEELSAAAPRN